MRKRLFYVLFSGLMLFMVESCRDNSKPYVQKPFFIESTNGLNGTILPYGVNPVTSRHPNFKFYPNEGYERDSLVVNGKLITEDTLKFASTTINTHEEFTFFTLDSIYSTIYVSFKKIKK